MYVLYEQLTTVLTIHPPSDIISVFIETYLQGLRNIQGITVGVFVENSRRTRHAKWKEALPQHTELREDLSSGSKP